MKIMRLDYNQKELFGGFDPFEKLRTLDTPGSFALIAVLEAEDGDIPAGILIARLNPKSLVINWLYIDPGARRKGLGEALLDEVLEIAKEEQQDLVCAVSDHPYGWDTLCPYGEKYFLEHDFVPEDPLPNDSQAGKVLSISTDSYLEKKRKQGELPHLRLIEQLSLSDYEEDKMPHPVFRREQKDQDVEVTVGDIAKSDLLKADTKQKEVIGIGQLTLTEFHDGLEYFLSKRPAPWFEENLLEESFERFEPVLSGCINTDDGIKGLCLVSRMTDGKLWVEYLTCVDRDVQAGILKLLRYAAAKVVETYPMDTPVILRCHNEVVTRLVKAAFILNNGNNFRY